MKSVNDIGSDCARDGGGIAVADPSRSRSRHIIMERFVLRWLEYAKLAL